jgi:hypothetical protein
MTTLTAHPAYPKSIPVPSKESQGLLSLGRQRNWDFKILGQAPLPHQPIHLQDWLIVPAHQDSSHIPARALERIQAIFAMGLRPKGFVIVHEAPKLLPAPEKVDPEPVRLPSTSPDFKPLITGLLRAVGVVIPVAAAAVSMIVPATLALGAFLLDPILVAVTEDNTWIEIDRWWSQV